MTKCNYSHKCTRNDTAVCASCRHNQIRDYYEPVNPIWQWIPAYSPWYSITASDTSENAVSSDCLGKPGTGDYFHKPS